MKAPTPKESQPRKAMRRSNLLRRRSCRRCPLRGPWGECLASGLKSGRCGDWVWYMRGRKQCRHLYVKPMDPRTPRQQLWRTRFRAASKKYSHSMADDQRDACISAGAKLRTRPRLGQSGPLTGQQYSIRREYAAKAWEGGRPRRPKLKESIQTAQKAQKGLQTQGISRSTSDPHRGITGVPPGQRRWDVRRGSKSGGTRKDRGGRRWKAMTAPELLQPYRLTRPGGLRYRNTPRAVRWRGASWKAAQSHPKATTKPVDSQAIGTPKPLQSHPNATLMRP